LEYHQSFVIAEQLQGGNISKLSWRGTSSGYDTLNDRVARRDGKVVAYAQFWEPSPYYAVTDEATSPYHVIKVRRDDGVIQETELVLQSRAVTPTPPSR
jgi:hypothetical protein